MDAVVDVRTFIWNTADVLRPEDKEETERERRRFP